MQCHEKDAISFLVRENNFLLKSIHIFHICTLNLMLGILEAEKSDQSRILSQVRYPEITSTSEKKSP